MQHRNFCNRPIHDDGFEGCVSRSIRVRQVNQQPATAHLVDGRYGVEIVISQAALTEAAYDELAAGIAALRQGTGMIEEAEAS